MLCVRIEGYEFDSWGCLVFKFVILLVLMRMKKVIYVSFVWDQDRVCVVKMKSKED